MNKYIVIEKKTFQVVLGAGPRGLMSYSTSACSEYAPAGSQSNTDYFGKLFSCFKSLVGWLVGWLD